RTGPAFEAGDAVKNGPSHERIDRQRRIGTDRVRARRLHLSTARPDDESPDAAIGNQHVRTAAKNRDGHVVAMSDTEGADDLVAAADLDEPFSRSPDAEGRHGRERDLPDGACVSEFGCERLAELSSSHGVPRWRRRRLPAL